MSRHDKELRQPLADTDDASDAIPVAPERVRSGLRGSSPHGLHGLGSPSHVPPVLNEHNHPSSGDYGALKDTSNGNGSDVEKQPILSTLKKNSLTIIHCLAMSITMIAPTTSIYFMSGQIAEFAGASAPFVILLSAAISLCLASSILQFSQFVSTSGSFFSFISLGLGPSWGVMSALLMLCGYGLLGMQSLLQMAAWFGDVIQRNTHAQVHWAYLAVGITIVIAVLAYLGLSQSLTISLVMAALEACVILVFSVIIVKDGGAEGNYPKALLPEASFGSIAHSLVFGILVFCGFEGAAALGEETANPRQNIGRAVVGSVCITALYMCWGVYAMIIGKGPSMASSLYLDSSPSDSFARRYISDWFAVFVDLAGCTAVYTVTVGNFNYNFRLLYCFGKQGLLGFQVCGRTHSKRQTPVVAIFAFSTVACGGALLTGLLAGTENSTAPAWRAYGWLGYVGTLPVIAIYMLTQAALPFYIRTHQPASYHRFWHAILPAITFCLYLVPLVGNFYPNPPVSPFNYFVYGLLGWIAFSACIVLYYRRIPAAVCMSKAPRTPPRGSRSSAGSGSGTATVASMLTSPAGAKLFASPHRTGSGGRHSTPPRTRVHGKDIGFSPIDKLSSPAPAASGGTASSGASSSASKALFGASTASSSSSAAAMLTSPTRGGSTPSRPPRVWNSPHKATATAAAGTGSATAAAAAASPQLTGSSGSASMISPFKKRQLLSAHTAGGSGGGGEDITMQSAASGAANGVSASPMKKPSLLETLKALSEQQSGKSPARPKRTIAADFSLVGSGAPTTLKDVSPTKAQTAAAAAAAVDVKSSVSPIASAGGANTRHGGAAAAAASDRQTPPARSGTSDSPSLSQSGSTPKKAFIKQLFGATTIATAPPPATASAAAATASTAAAARDDTIAALSRSPVPELVVIADEPSTATAAAATAAAATAATAASPLASAVAAAAGGKPQVAAATAKKPAAAAAAKRKRKQRK